MKRGPHPNVALASSEGQNTLAAAEEKLIHYTFKGKELSDFPTPNSDWTSQMLWLVL